MIARTAALRHEGAAADATRARAYEDAGADIVLVPLPHADGELEQIRAAVDVPLATIGLLDHAENAYERGVTLFIDSITRTPSASQRHRNCSGATRRDCLRGWAADIMATYRGGARSAVSRASTTLSGRPPSEGPECPNPRPTGRGRWTAYGSST